MELTHEPEPTEEEITRAQNTLRFFWDMVGKSLLIFSTLAGGWIIGNNPASVFGVDVPVHLNFVTVAVAVAVTVEIFSAGVTASRSRHQKKPESEPQPQSKMKPAIILAVGLGLAGLFIMLFFGYLIIRNAMLAV